MTRALLLALLLLPSGAGAGARHGIIRGIQRAGPGIRNTDTPQLLITESPAMLSHVWFDGLGIRDTRWRAWTMAGAVPQVLGALALPPGAGPFSVANYYKHDPLGTGADDLDTSGNFRLVLVYTPTATAAQPVFADTDGSTKGFYASANPGTGRVLTTFDPSGHGLNSVTTKPVASAVNVLCVGRSGSNLVAIVNAGAQVTLAAGVTPATSSPVLIGTDGAGLSYADGTLLEAAFFLDDPTSAACAAAIADVKRRAQITAW